MTDHLYVEALAVRETIAPWGDDEEPPDPVGEFVDVCNPWGSLGHDDRHPVRLTIWEAAELASEFPGAIWGTDQECDPDTNWRTGETCTVTLFLEGPAAPAALELARTWNRRRDSRRRLMLWASGHAPTSPHGARRRERENLRALIDAHGLDEARRRLRRYSHHRKGMHS